MSRTVILSLALLVAAPLRAGIADQDLVTVDSPDFLVAIEKAGFSFSEMVLQEKGLDDNKALNDQVNYRAITTVLATDLDARAAVDKYLGPTMGTKHRLFDKKWLTSSKARYELVGIMNRLDRAPFAGDVSNDGLGRCGEIRFIYRLAYSMQSRGQPIFSRLPMTVNVVYWAIGDTPNGSQDCSAIAKDWQLDAPLASDKIASALLAKGKALSHARFTAQSLKSVEVNLQSVRWPSTIRPDMGGYAEYTMRVFRKDRRPGRQGNFVPFPMENMPDVAKISGDAALKRELIAWLKTRENLQRFDEGTGVLPEKFLATKAVSIAFHGMNRSANRPFERLVQQSDLDGLSWKDLKYIKSPHAYLRRLNDMSCVGCHQGRSVAGFHFVGIDRPETLAANAIFMAASAHLARDQQRRRNYLTALAAGKATDPTRPFSDRAESGEGGYGSHCAIGKDPSYTAWTCNAGLSCKAYDTNVAETEIGYCIQDTRPLAGDPCDVGRLTAQADPLRDEIKNKNVLSCGAGLSCYATQAGFPGGLCFGGCNALRKGEACSAIAVEGFNECLGRGENFTICLTKHTAPVSTRACDEDNPCRDDFICTRTGPKSGACIPPYFLFQLRLDGHPRPAA